eukprot:TRINITY_DN4568_c0_g1_i1.p1 TRINITY_DN4568_c0_g1~~TRINITY_DN4568_c0_g1_i1.p1  ORF type:complete len:325 (+),score=98.39 TRINITY_DN4568_c0_g1_i1:40-1014(+)
MSGEWLSPEEAAELLGGGFEGSDSMDGGEATIMDSDGDVTTLVREAGNVAVFVVFKSGKKERVGVANELHVNVDTRSLIVSFQRDGTKERTWTMSLPKEWGKEEGAEVLKKVFAVSRSTGLSLKVRTENGLRSAEEPVKEMAKQYAMLLGGSILPCEKDLAVMKEGEQILTELERVNKELKEISFQSTHLRDDVVPTLVVASKQLEVIFSSIDILGKWVGEMNTHLDTLETALNTYSAPTSFMSKAKKLFSIGKKAKATPDILAIGGVPPQEFEANLHKTVSKFIALNEAPKRPSESTPVKPSNTLPQVSGEACGEEAEGEESE